MARTKTADRDMTQGGIFRALLLFSLPLLAGNFFQQCYNTVDSIVLGNFVGKAALAAVGTTTPIINTLIGLFLGLSAGIGVVISQFYGAKEEEKVGQAVQTSLLLVLLLCGVFTAVGIAMVPGMLRLMATPADVFPQAARYLRIYFAGVSGLMLYNLGAGILRAVGDARRPLYFLLFSAGVNTGLDLLFVAVFHWGIAGAAIATVAAQVLSAGLVLGAAGLLRLESMAGQLLQRGKSRMVLAVTLHNLPEGMVVGLAAALALSGEPDAVSGALALSLGIGLQNIPEGAAVSLPLAHSGRTRLQAFGAGAASGLVEPLGALAAFALAGWVQAALPWLMSAAAGCMVCVTAQEMIPEAVEQDEPAGVVSIVLGFALMMALDVAL